MDYTNLINNISGKISKVGIIGATRGYGYTLLAQIPKVKHMDLRIICSRHTDECMNVLKEIGYGERDIVVCQNKEEVKKASETAVLIVSDYRLVMESGITALVECTGNTAVSSDAALSALRRGINVYMVSKETDSVCGPVLNQIAAENGAVYALVNGDQPRNLLDLYSWAMLLGLEVIAAGKSSEYDFVWDRETGDFSYLDGVSPTENLPELLEHWQYKGTETLDARRRLLEKYTEIIAADLCEMNLVSNITGLVPSSPFLSYPIAKTSELANIFIPKEDGGILDRTGVVDVFYNLRGTDEASFCGGEFITVKCDNPKMWDILKGKGHVMSRNGKYACIYYPYHYMGLETPVSVLLGDLMGIGAHPECRQVSVLAGVAQEDLPKGTVLTVKGHHHSIEGLVPELLERKEVGNIAPFYLLNGAALLKDVKKGEPITLDHVDLSQLEAYKLYAQGLKL
ncbi:homoserine dehydrogenase [Lacrimispora sp. 210928-DFI.3.58]|uniref:homoserine dehydrogenase n=1 Tax=Lacrimispora sp. 210928-DFI.3.58 TaxID=2883214 RepID=UPI001D066626|nr:homoserine dehydrogenase [Lacrimispora sp. 210928-DFI.3.58]MCB7320563.1 homoserine dehydrogenase [Lacrimispora sp. 210928-DFI.3.58]